MQRKHNKDIVPTAKMLRKNMTKEEKTFGMISCAPILSTFLEEYGLTVVRIPNTEIHKNFLGFVSISTTS